MPEEMRQLYWLFTASVFMVGACVGSFINVVIWRLPRGESIVTVPSHCPHCNRNIPFYDNIPIIGWLMLRGRCRSCKASISPRYILVESLVACLFLAIWFQLWQKQWPVAVLPAYCWLAASLVAAAFIDLRHRIIPNGLTYLGIAVGLLFGLLFPLTHLYVRNPDPVLLRLLMERHILSWVFIDMIAEQYPPILRSARLFTLADMVLGLVFGAGVLWLLGEGGKMLFGRRRVELEEPISVVFREEGIRFGDEDKEWEDLYYRESDLMRFQGRITALVFKDGREECPSEEATGELIVGIDRLRWGEREEALEGLDEIRLESSGWVEPREAMGMGDIKLMAMLGIFLGPGACIFILLLSSLLAIGGTLIGMLAGKGRFFGQLIAYGPYIVIAAFAYMLAREEIIGFFARLVLRFLP